MLEGFLRWFLEVMLRSSFNLCSLYFLSLLSGGVTKIKIYRKQPLILHLSVAVERLIVRDQDRGRTECLIEFADIADIDTQLRLPAR